jgi:hypothetical protein
MHPKYSEDSKSVLTFPLALAIVEFLAMHLIKVAKHIWDPCCHLKLTSPHLRKWLKGDQIG